MNLKKILLALVVVLAVFSFTSQQPSTKYKCMIQLTNYQGEGAYIVVSLLDPNGTYVKTLQVLGDDPEWYSDLPEWWKFYGKRETIDAITGATISGGQRAIKIIEIDEDKLNKGYKLRFETAVEDQKYYAKDVEFELTTENLKAKIEGNGYIRYVRMMPN
ncbi:DUF2271 domain-containing protein [Capnocytophaga canimorsus]|uniref:DUF2271 domain-containing protein n=1 Tax=Capnocytophaga canimorsus TaxID=28188 RepID=UPI000D6E1479|nr:DUF2271 domain-containing protein [Capnocytophaga canimorsus]AWL78544.1 DUF2271 domain-containing protein [Capnocytophaga canimorsus]AYW37156.1 DUF2271 domain-containing protein [Capnocytophaga canimorsus]MDT9499902.1 DUF2271 domain-containing protein [Capnocytophaga canimorsus]